jgi:hypothetical protein
MKINRSCNIYVRRNINHRNTGVGTTPIQQTAYTKCTSGKENGQKHCDVMFHTLTETFRETAISRTQERN